MNTQIYRHKTQTHTFVGFCFCFFWLIFVYFLFFFWPLILQDLGSKLRIGTRPQQWKCWVLPTGPPGKSPSLSFLFVPYLFFFSIFLVFVYFLFLPYELILRTEPCSVRKSWSRTFICLSDLTARHVPTPAIEASKRAAALNCSSQLCLPPSTVTTHWWLGFSWFPACQAYAFAGADNLQILRLLVVCPSSTCTSSTSFAIDAVLGLWSCHLLTLPVLIFLILLI